MVHFINDDKTQHNAAWVGRRQMTGVNWRALAGKAVTLAAVTLLLAWFYGWASPWAYPGGTTAGFGYGMLHGVMMPMALRSLVLGKNVEIYAANNAGIRYKIGYIAGINLCGLIFFGSVFLRPVRKICSDKSE